MALKNLNTDRGVAVEYDPCRWDPLLPQEFAARLAGSKAEWMVVGGWALDLWLGRAGTSHSDLEIAVGQFEIDEIVDCFPECDWYVLGANGLRCLADAGGYYFDYPQTLAVDRATGGYRVDVIRNQYDGCSWVFQLDRRIRAPRREVFAVTADGVPYLRPEYVLLYKALGGREKDDCDFRAALEPMDEYQIGRLSDMLGLIEPEHRWLATLRAS